MNEVWDMQYDFRNLLLECTSKNTDIQNPANGDAIYYTKYNYDEAGNRISKLIWKYNSDDPHPTFPAGSWPYEKTEFYIRNISGAEIATYNAAQAVQFWNIWGSDNVGRIKGNGEKEFYLKDHLGSIRAVLNENSEILSSQDLDVWGHKIDGRKYVADKPSKYQFTSKERDLESDYDYFGARYYDSRNGRWGGVEPLYDKFIGYSPFEYGLNNPINLIDKDGNEVDGPGPRINTMVKFEEPGGGPSLQIVIDIGVATTAVIGVVDFIKKVYHHHSKNNNSNDEVNNKTHENSPPNEGTIDDSKRGDKIGKSESPVWQGLDAHKGKTKTSGKGKSRRYYEWDKTHGDIEVYNKNGKHIGSMDPITGEIYKKGVKGRKIEL